jgi:hypothetical protein
MGFEGSYGFGPATVVGGVRGDVRGVVPPEGAIVTEVATVFGVVAFGAVNGTTIVRRVVGVEPPIADFFEPLVECFVAVFAAARLAVRAVAERFFECAVAVDDEWPDARVVGELVSTREVPPEHAAAIAVRTDSPQMTKTLRTPEPVIGRAYAKNGSASHEHRTAMYIGLGTIVVILLVLLLIGVLR